MIRMHHRFVTLFFVIFFITCSPSLPLPPALAEPPPAAPGLTSTPPPPPTTPQPEVAAPKRADPIFVFEVGSVVMEKANGLAVANGLAYVSSEAGLHVLDLSDPAAPRQIGLLSYLQEFVHYWLTQFDWCKQELLVADIRAFFRTLR